MRLYDRIRGEWIEQPIDEPIPGRFSLGAIGGARYLTSDFAGRWTVDSTMGEFPRRLLADDALRGAVREIAAVVRVAIAAGALGDLLAESPLASGGRTRLEVSPFERKILATLPFIESIMRHPRAWLKRETERVGVERARRLSPRASGFLASHSEDWERITLSGLKPRRVLALVTEDQLDIYENRVTTELVDQLERYLRARIDQVGTIHALRRDQIDFSKEGARSMHHMRRRRVCELWGDAAEAQSMLKLAGETLEFLDELLRRLQALKGSPICRVLPGRRGISQLRPTNILVNDRNYRKVYELFLSWVREQRRSEPPRNEQIEAHSKFLGDLEEFCLLLVVRAMAGVVPFKESCPFPRLGADIPLDSLDEGGLNAHLRRDHDGAITLMARGCPPLRFIPLGARLVAEAQDGLLTTRLIQQIETALRSGKRNQGRVVVLYLGTGRESARGSEEIQRLALRFPMIADSESGRLGWLPVSPFDVESVERVGRAIRQWHTSSLYLSYPPELGLVPTHEPPPTPVIGTEIVRSQSRWRLLGKIPARDMAKLESWWSDRARRGAIAARASAPEWCAHAQDLESWASATARMQRLATCPVCSCSGRLEPRDRETFQGTCPGCNARWGLRLCGKCGSRFPFLDLDYDDADLGLPADDRWVEQHLGRDVLAAPCWLPGERVFICPSCGSCPKGEGELAVACERCRARS